MKLFVSIYRSFNKLENTLLVVGMLVLLLVSSAQIIMRNTLSITLPWADPFIRHLVLWIGFLGALIATRENKHVKIDAIQRLLPTRSRSAVEALSHLLASSVCFILTWQSWRFIADEREFSTLAFSGLMAWKFQLIFPIVFAGMALRYLTYAVSGFTALIRQPPPPTPS